LFHPEIYLELSRLRWLYCREFMDRREHHRVQLRLPVRLRWTTPFGQKTEVCDTVNVSRGGVLVPCQELHAVGMSLWVTFPYDPAIPYSQPEILAKVVRSVESQSTEARRTNGNGAEHQVGDRDQERPATKAGKVPEVAVQAADHSRPTVAALRFEIAPRHRSNGNGNGHGREQERRASPRQQLAVPVRVRPERVPWFEEAMTIDCSTEGLKFRGNREYRPGEYLVVSFESADTSPWPAAKEWILMVARLETVPESAALNVAVCRSRQFSFRF
jgi:hypothetical protein